MERLDRSDRAPPARGRDRNGDGDVRESRFHTSVAPDFGRQLRLLVEQQGAVLTADEMSYVEEWLPQCRGKEHWEVREYVAPTGLGAREYRVVRGSRVQDAYRSAEWVRAAAVRTALNELELPERPRDVPGATA